MQEQGKKFVERFEMAAMQYAILQKATQAEVTKENLQQLFRQGGAIPMKGQHLDHCLQQLTQENHLKQNGNKYTITDDGREDVQEISRLVMEIGTLAQEGGATQRSGQKQPATAGGYGAGQPPTSGTSVGGRTGGNVGGGQGR